MQSRYATLPSARVLQECIDHLRNEFQDGVDEARPVQPDSQFRIASLSKPEILALMTSRPAPPAWAGACARCRPA